MERALAWIDDLIRSPVAGVVWFFVTIAAAVGAQAVGLGFLVGIALAGLPFALAAARYLIVSPTATAIVIIVTETVNLSDVFAMHGLYLKIPQLCVALGIATIAYALRDPANRKLAVPPWWMSAGIAALLVGQLLTTVGSVDRSASLTWIYELVTTLLFLVVLFILMRLSGRTTTLALAFVVPMTVLAMLTVINQFVFGATQDFGGFTLTTSAMGELTTTPRQSGPLNDSNFWGRHLVMVLPIAAALFINARRIGQKRVVWVTGAALLILPAGMYMTQSRGTYLAALATMGVWAVLSGRETRRLALKVSPFLVLLMFVPGVGNRLLAVVGDVGSKQVYDLDLSVLGRTSAQEVAWAMFGDRPIFGFGPSSYLSQIPSYAGLVDTAVLKPTIAPHNLYAQIAAESGLIGLVCWALFILAFLGPAILRVLAYPPPKNRELIAAGAAAIVGWSIASVFLHMSYMRTLAVVLALGCAVAVGKAEKPELSLQPVFQRISHARPLIACGVVAAVAFVGVLALSSTQVATAKQDITLVPAGNYATAYQLDIRSRKSVIPTYALVIGNNNRIETFADPVRGVVAIFSRASDESNARTLLEDNLAVVEKRLIESGLRNSYSIRLVGDVAVSTTRQLTTASWIAALVASLATYLLCWWASRPGRTRNRIIEESHEDPQPGGPADRGGGVLAVRRTVPVRLPTR